MSIEVKKGYVLVEEKFTKKSVLVSLVDVEKDAGYSMTPTVLFAHEGSGLEKGDTPIFSKYAEFEYNERIKGEKLDQLIVNHCVYREDMIIGKKKGK